MAVAENWEDLLGELEDPAPVPPPPKPAPSPSRAKPAAKSFAAADEVLSDPVAERLRRQKLVEENEKRLMDDLFAGCERPEAPANDIEQRAAVSTKAAKALASTSKDPLDAIQLKTFRDCERFAELISGKILESAAKSPSWLRFLDLLFKECSPKMDLKDLKSLQSKLNSTIQQREKAEKQLDEKKKKPNSVASQCRNYQEELDIVYGGDSEDEVDDADDDDFM